MKEWLYGRNPVFETLRAGRRRAFQIVLAEGAQEKGRIKDILHMAQERGVPVVRSPRARLGKIHPDNQGVALECDGYPYIDLQDIFERGQQRSEALFVLILDSLQDAHNFGALFRTAEAVGVHGVLIPLARTVEVTPAVVNASSGTSEHLLITRINLHQGIQTLKRAGVWIVGLDQGAEAQEYTPELAHKSLLSSPLGLVIGSEGEGMHTLVRQSCDALLKLPMRGQVESLNAAVAGSVALYLASFARSQ